MRKTVLFIFMVFTSNILLNCSSGINKEEAEKEITSLLENYKYPQKKSNFLIDDFEIINISEPVLIDKNSKKINVKFQCKYYSFSSLPNSRLYEIDYDYKHPKKIVKIRSEFDFIYWKNKDGKWSIEKIEYNSHFPDRDTNYWSRIVSEDLTKKMIN